MAKMNLYLQEATVTVYAKPGERGVALIQTLMIMALMLALLMGISLTAISELGVTSTYAKQTIAMQAAEAGLNHALTLVRNYNGDDFTSLLALRPTSGSAEYQFNQDYLRGNNPFFSANNTYDATKDMWTFAPGSLMIDYDSANPSLGCPLMDATGVAVPGAYYKVSLIDNEPSSSTDSNDWPRVPNFTPLAGFVESNGGSLNNPWIDKDNRVVAYSTGTYSNASVTLEAWIAFVSYPALVSNTDINVSGGSLLGAFGSVHSNGTLYISGSPYIQQTATASGPVDTNGNGWQIDGFYGGLQPPIDLPKFVTNAPLTNGGPNTSPRIPDYLIQRANVILIDPGFADGAHKTDPTDTGNPATRRLNNLANRLNVSYASLIAALEQDSSNTGMGIKQTNEAALKITRSGTPPAPYLQPLGTADKVNVSDIGWSYNSGSGGSWSIPPSGGATINVNVNDGTNTGNAYYVVGLDNYNLNNPSNSTANGGNVNLSGNLGNNLDNITIMATGSIITTGTTNFTAKLREIPTPELPPFVKPDFLFVAVQDVKIRGDVDAANENAVPKFNGVVYCGEQFDLSGNGDFNGQVIGLGNTHTSGSPVDQNIETGSFTLTLNNGNSLGKVKIVSWRQIKR